MVSVRSDPKRLAGALTTETEESCTTYNMLKVLHLFMFTKLLLCCPWLYASYNLPTKLAGFAPSIQMDQGNRICGLLRASTDQRRTEHSERQGSWCDDLHVTTGPWEIKGNELPWLGNSV
jgi:hypothetical protein